MTSGFQIVPLLKEFTSPAERRTEAEWFADEAPDLSHDEP